MKYATAQTEWVSVPRDLTFGMRIALEEAIIRHDKNLDRVWREVLDFAPLQPKGITTYKEPPQ